ncbi:hypothetical protein D3C74_328490 [compost metagenome]
MNFQQGLNQTFFGPLGTRRHRIGAAVQGDQGKNQTVAALAGHIVIVIDFFNQVIAAEVLRICTCSGHTQHQTLIVRNLAELALAG